jgi:hypothetical protein
VSARRKVAEDEGLKTEFVLASDLRVYVNSGESDPKKLRGRKIFEGLAFKWSAENTPGALIIALILARPDDGR